MTNLNPRYKRIPPRAEELVRYINDVMVFDFAVNRTTGAVLDLPDVVAFAHMVVNEVGTISVQDFGLDVTFVPNQ